MLRRRPLGRQAVNHPACPAANGRNLRVARAAHVGVRCDQARQRRRAMSWADVPGGGQTVDAPAAALFEDRIWVFVRAADGSVWANHRGDEADWPGWEQISPPGTLASAPTAVVKGGGLYLF